MSSDNGINMEKVHDDIEVELSDDFLEARSVQLDQELRVGRTGGRGKFTLPHLKQYGVVVLE